MPCHSMTSHSQLRIANSHASCLPPIDEAVDELFQGCGRKIPRHIFLEHSMQLLTMGNWFQRDGGLHFFARWVKRCERRLEDSSGMAQGGGVAAMSKTCQNGLKLYESHLYWIWLGFLCGGLEILTWTQFRHPCWALFGTLSSLGNNFFVILFWF